MYRESDDSVPSAEFTVVALLAPVAMVLALGALMALFLGTGLAQLAPLRELLMLSAVAAALWIVSALLRPGIRVGRALRRLPAWCWVAGCSLLTLALLALLALVLAARLVDTALGDPLLATATLVLGVVSFWFAFGIARPGSGPSRFAGPGVPPEP